MRRRACLLACLALALAGCDAREVTFCEDFIRGGLATDANYRRLEVAISDRSLRPIEAQKLLYPNFDPQAHFKRRPDNVPRILVALEAMQATLRTVEIAFRVAAANGTERQARERCRFLLLSGVAQHVSKADLDMMRTLQGLARLDGKRAECCIQTNADVR